MTCEALIDESPFGLRLLIRREGRPVGLFHSLPHRREAELGQLFVAKAKHQDKRLGGQIFDLGAFGEGFLPKPKRPYGQGESVLLVVRREAIGTKRPVLAERPLLRLPTVAIDPVSCETRPGPIAGNAATPGINGEPPHEPGLFSPIDDAARFLGSTLPSDTISLLTASGALAARLRPFFPEGFDLASAEGVSPLIDEAEEQALARTAPLPGGGAMVFDETEALTAIDIDLGAGQGQSGKGAAESLKARVFDHLAPALMLRGIGGQVVLDLPRAANRAPKVLRDQLNSALKRSGLVSIPAVTKDGLVVMQFGRARPSVLERMTRAEGGAVRPARVLRADHRATSAYRRATDELDRGSRSSLTVALDEEAAAIWRKLEVSDAIARQYGLVPTIETRQDQKP
jgi:hypothetical protein